MRGENRRVANIAGALAVLILPLGGCDPAKSDEYPISLETARKRLFAADFRDFRADRQCGILLHFAMKREESREIEWAVVNTNKTLFRYTVKLEPIGPEKTRVDLEISTNPNGRESYDGTQVERFPGIEQPLRPALEEKIDSVLRERDYVPQPIQNIQPEINRQCNLQRGVLESGDHVNVDRHINGYDYSH
jgi:hypothetical protein